MLAAPVALQATEVTFGYADTAAELTTLPYEYAALRIQESNLAGSKVVGATVKVDAEPGDTVVLWVRTKQLVNPSKITFDAQDTIIVDGRGYATARFEKPVEYTGLSAIYIGATGQGLQARQQPSTDGCRAWDGSTWVDLSDTYTLDMEVLFESEWIEQVGVAFDEQPEFKVTSTDGLVWTVAMRQAGAEAISTLTYKYEAASVAKEAKLTFEPEIDARFGTTFSFDVEVGALPEGEMTEAVITITELNGQPYNLEGSTTVSVLAFVPRRLPLMEEYTGTWCGNCPRGMAGMEYMSDSYPDEFIGVAYHTGDEMAITTTFYVDASSAPLATLDRGDIIDPYYGSDNAATQALYIEQDWLAARDELALADVEVKAQWLDEEATQLDIAATVNFAVRPSSEMRLSYLVTADGLSNPTWIQHNYLAGQASNLPDEPYIQKYAAMDEYVALEFNHVVVGMTSLTGIEGSLPEEIEPCVDYGHGIQPSMAGSLIQDADRVHVVAYVCDTRGRIINAAKCKVTAFTAINTVGVDEQASGEPLYYDLQGRPMAEPRGFYIERRGSSVTKGFQR